MGDQSAELLRSMIAKASVQDTGLAATTIGVVTLLITASGHSVRFSHRSTRSGRPSRKPGYRGWCVPASPDLGSY